jgi:integrase
MTATKLAWKDKIGERRETWGSTFYDDAGTRHRKSGFKTKRLAETWEAKERERLRRSALFPKKGNSPTIRSLCLEWLTRQKEGLGDKPPIETATYKKYEASFRLHVYPAIGEVPLAEFNKQAAIDFRTHLIKTIGRSMARSVMKHFSVPMNYAVEREHFTTSPTAKLTVSVDTREAKKIRMPTREEMIKILKELVLLGETDAAWFGFTTLFFLLQGTGLRISEARGLPWSAVDLTNGFLSVSQRADNFGVIGRVKSRAAIREVPLSDLVVRLLKRWQPNCPKGSADLVFPNSMGKLQSKSNLYHRRWVPLCERCGLGSRRENGGWSAPFGFHAMRHFRVSELIADGVDISQIMSEVGHAKVSLIFDTYGHVFKDERLARRERSNRLSEDLVKIWSND